MTTITFFNQLTAMPKRLAMVLTVLFTLGVGSMLGETATNNCGSALSTTAKDMESGKLIQWKVSETNSYSNPIRVYANTTITITAKSGVKRITQVEVTASSTGYYVTNTEGATWTASGTGTCSVGTKSVSGKVITVPMNGDVTKVTIKPSAQTRWSKVVVTYELVASCDKKVTLTKGSETNGSFTLDKEDGSYDNCDADFVVKVSDVQPNSNSQYCSGINVTGGNSTVTGPVDGVWTVTYAKGNNITSTITPTFANKTAASITLSEAGVETPVTGKYVGDSYTLPSTTSQSCGDLEFVGWSTVEINNSASKPASNYYAKGASVTLAANQTFYAVFAEEGGNDEETVLVNFTGGTKSDLTNLTGISASGLGSDYAENNAPYRVKLDDTGDYILYTNESNQYISQIYLKVKMIGGANTSTITLKTSDDNINFTTITNHNISGDQNNVKELSIEANTSAKYIQLYYTKGSNVGLGLLVIYAKSSSFQNYTTQCITQTTVFVIPKCGGDGGGTWLVVIEWFATF